MIREFYIWKWRLERRVHRRILKTRIWLDDIFGIDRPTCSLCGKKLGRSWKGTAHPLCSRCLAQRMERVH